MILHQMLSMGEEQYWLRVIEQAGGSFKGALDYPTSGIAVDTQGNIYVFAASAGTSNLVIGYKFNKKGTLIWSKNYTDIGFGTADTIIRVLTDGTRVYIGSHINNRITAINCSDGTVSWYKYTTGATFLMDMCWDGSGSTLCVVGTDGADLTLNKITASSGADAGSELVDIGGYTVQDQYPTNLIYSSANTCFYLAVCAYTGSVYNTYALKIASDFTAAGIVGCFEGGVWGGAIDPKANPVLLFHADTTTIYEIEVNPGLTAINSDNTINSGVDTIKRLVLPDWMVCFADSGTRQAHFIPRSTKSGFKFGITSISVVPQDMALMPNGDIVGLATSEGATVKLCLFKIPADFSRIYGTYGGDKVFSASAAGTGATTLSHSAVTLTDVGSSAIATATAPVVTTETSTITSVEI